MALRPASPAVDSQAKSGNAKPFMLDLFKSKPERPSAPDQRPSDPAVESSVAVQATNLGKCYGDFWAVRGVNLTVTRGESLGIVGLNGAGKSTLLQIVAGTIPPSEGSVKVSGRVLALLDLGAGFNDDFTGLENLYLSASLHGVPKSTIDGHLGEIEDFAEIGEFIRKPMRTYSSGMKVRLAFALLTQVRPELMIIDEALAVGDAYFAHKCVRLVRQFRDEGRSLLFVSHDPGAVKAFCDHAILMDRGVVIREGQPNDVLDYYNAMIAVKEREMEIRVSEAATGRRRTRSGDGRAMLDRFDLQDEHGKSVRAVLCGSPVRIVCAVEFRETVAGPTVGFLIRDRLGNEIFGTNTSYLGIATRTYAPGECLEVAFSLPLNLGPGNYSLTMAVHAGADHRAGNYDWYDNLLAFSVVPQWPFVFAGVAALPTSAQLTDGVRFLTRECSWGEPIDFTETGNAQRYLVSGWSSPEPTHCWTQGTEASIAVRLPDGSGDVKLTADVYPYLPPDMRAQEVQIGCGETVLGRWKISKPSKVEVIIPDKLRTPASDLRIWWRLPGATSPSSVGAGTDTRVLALAFRRIVFQSDL